ncbi:hypothetical protein ACJ2A9_09645 [Anaerobacillus sp. MEB173]|uniref:hypothetical protein n=1 Tax=Anaerobacillus sp. MEB173 TaxID=3383345 RepID=UPI003F8E75FA
MDAYIIVCTNTLFEFTDVEKRFNEIRPVGHRIEIKREVPETWQKKGYSKHCERMY